MTFDPVRWRTAMQEAFSVVQLMATPPQTAAWIAGLAADCPGDYMELGCHEGLTLLHVAAAIAESDRPRRRVYGVEPDTARVCKAERVAAEAGLLDPAPFIFHGTVEQVASRADFRQALQKVGVLFFDQGGEGWGTDGCDGGKDLYLEHYKILSILIPYGALLLAHDTDCDQAAGFIRALRDDGHQVVRLPVPRGMIVARMAGA